MPAVAVVSPRRAVPGRVLVAHAAVPGLAGVGLAARRRAEVGARPDDPDQEQKARDGPDDDASYGAAGERLGVGGVVAAAVVGAAGSDDRHRGVRRGLPGDEVGELECLGRQAGEELRYWCHDSFCFYSSADVDSA